jgi:hypothetical protein
MPFDKLKGHINYSNSKFQMELYLVHDGLHDYMTEMPASDDATNIERD